MPITITETPVVNPGGARTAHHFGIGEIIDLTAAIAPAPVGARPPIWRWAVTSGADRGHFSFNGNQARVILFSMSGGTMTIQVRNTWDDMQATLNLTIVAPINWSLGPIQYRYHEAGHAHAAFRAAVQVQNNHNVSFDNLEMREGNAKPIPKGRYATEGVNTNFHHAQTFALRDRWINIGTSRLDAALQAAASAGNIAIEIDRVGSHVWGPPFNENGTFTWRIPWTYRLNIPVAQAVDVNGTAVQIPDPGIRQVNNVVTHLEQLVGNQMTMSKGGRTQPYTAATAAVGNYATFNA